jgi:hypothetical protein
MLLPGSEGAVEPKEWNASSTFNEIAAWIHLFERTCGAESSDDFVADR